IADEMKDEDLLRLVKRLGYEEGLPVVVDPGIIKPRDFIDEVVNVRIPNPFMPDTPQRIACDTSQKLSIRFGETIKGYLDRPDLSIENLKVLPLVFALWLRYLMAIDDNGNPFELSPDPLLEDVKRFVVPAVPEPVEGVEGFEGVEGLDTLLHRKEIFGVDLFEAGLAGKVKEYFAKLNSGKGSVRKLLKEI
ncbi:MAG: mannitol dehydrogenase family protein, partial [Treponema sp.]|nr:mannitol dehydrogenase family protein [Treponema sp.]